jgi:hypothetical protein
VAKKSVKMAIHGTTPAIVTDRQGQHTLKVIAAVKHATATGRIIDAA